MKRHGTGMRFQATRRSIVAIVGAMVLVLAVGGYALARSGGFLDAATLTSTTQPSAVQQATPATVVGGQDEAGETPEAAEVGEATEANEATEVDRPDAADSDHEAADGDHDGERDAPEAADSEHDGD
jgi:hypothetical protein